MNQKTILAFVGMPGAGKSEAASYLEKKGVLFVRFGKFTDEEISKQGLPLISENERIVREKFREDLGMAAYAIMALPKIRELLKESDVIALDGLYSWEEYILLKEEFPYLILVHIYAEPSMRYNRLEGRSVRPVPQGKSRERDIAELEKLNKGGPIAIADFCVQNSGEMEIMYSEIDKILRRLTINI